MNILKHFLIALLLLVGLLWRKRAKRDGKDVFVLTYCLWGAAVFAAIDIGGFLMGYWG